MKNKISHTKKSINSFASSFLLLFVLLLICPLVCSRLKWKEYQENPTLPLYSFFLFILASACMKQGGEWLKVRTSNLSFTEKNYASTRSLSMPRSTTLCNATEIYWKTQMNHHSSQLKVNNYAHKLPAMSTMFQRPSKAEIFRVVCHSYERILCQIMRWIVPQIHCSNLSFSPIHDSHWNTRHGAAQWFSPLRQWSCHCRKIKRKWKMSKEKRRKKKKKEKSISKVLRHDSDHTLTNANCSLREQREEARPLHFSTSWSSLFLCFVSSFCHKPSIKPSIKHFLDFVNFNPAPATFKSVSVTCHLPLFFCAVSHGRTWAW